MNSRPLPQPTGALTAAPGDTLTAKIFVRDWSPHGQVLRAMEATMSDASYESGQAGSIAPVDYSATTLNELPNKSNAFIDTFDRQYIFGGRKEIAAVDSIALGYRYMNVLQSMDDARPSAQDGSKYSCGTLNLRISEDAMGTFVITFDETALHESDSTPIEPVAIEPLIVHVVDFLRVVSSEPANGAIDARAHAGPAGKHAGWNTVGLLFNVPPAGLSADDFSVDDGTTHPPKIRDLSTDGKRLVVRFDRGISLGRWTQIVHKASGTSTRIGFLPGDVNNDGLVTNADLVAVVPGAGGAEKSAALQADIDGDGVPFQVGDALRLVELLNRPDVYQAVMR